MRENKLTGTATNTGGKEWSSLARCFDLSGSCPSILLPLFLVTEGSPDDSTVGKHRKATSKQQPIVAAFAAAQEAEAEANAIAAQFRDDSEIETALAEIERLSQPPDDDDNPDNDTR